MMTTQSRTRRALSLLFCLSLLSACASTSSPATRYLLPEVGGAAPAGVANFAAAGVPQSDVAASGTITRSTARTLVIGPLRLAGFLDTPGIVLQLDDITLNEAAGHRWAEDLSLQLQRGLRERLLRRLDDTRVLSDVGSLPDAMQLRVEVRAFHGRHDGQAVAAGNWQLRGPAGELLDQQSFSVETPLRADGYPELVRALGRSWDAVAEQIAGRVRGLEI